jgi:hypothetical protein
MRTTALITALFMTTLGTAACDKKDDAAKDAKADAKKDSKDAKKEDPKDVKAADGGAADGGAAADGGGAAGEIALPKVGLKGDAPAGSNVSEMMGSDMVQGPGLVATVEKGDDKPKTGEDAQKDADMYTPQDAKVETLPDGYVLTFTNTGGMGTNYWVQSRREIDGAAYWCSTTASSQEQSDAAVAFCKSLRK